MSDREKVIEGLECCTHHDCYDCYQEGPGFGIACRDSLMRDALAVLKEQEASGWISVKDRLPENAEHLGSFCPRYQVMTKYGTTEGWYNPDKGCWYTLVWFLIGRFDEDDIDMERGDIPRLSKKIDVTHWMPLHEPPEEVTGDV